MTVDTESRQKPAQLADGPAARLPRSLRPPTRPSRLSASLTMGLRALLKVRRTPEQLADAIMRGIHRYFAKNPPLARSRPLAAS